MIFLAILLIFESTLSIPLLFCTWSLYFVPFPYSKRSTPSCIHIDTPAMNPRLCSAIFAHGSHCNQVACELPQMTRCSDHQHTSSPRLNAPDMCGTMLENGSFCPRVAFCVPIMTRCSDHYLCLPFHHSTAGQIRAIHNREIQGKYLAFGSRLRLTFPSTNRQFNLDNNGSDVDSEASTIVLE